MSKLAQFCSGTIEMACLSAVLLIPVFFNPLALTAYQRDKTAIFQCLAILVLAAGLIRVIEQRSIRHHDWRKLFGEWGRPMILPWIVMGAIYLVTAFFSLNPGQSFWGSYEHLQGVYTFFCGLVVAGAVATHFQGMDRKEHLLDVIFISGFPVALYAIIQRAGYDPIGHAEQIRVHSSLGNPIFLGAFLAMILPIGFWRLGRIARPAAGSGPVDSLRWVRIAGYGLILVVQLVAFFLSGSRGPLIGLLTALIFLTALSAFERKQIRRVFFVAVAAALVILALLFWAWRTSAHGTGESDSILSRYASTLSVADRSGRTELWQEAARMILGRDPIKSPANQPDSTDQLRRWFGFGPESLANVLPNSFSFPVPNARLETRFHNLIWDSWISTGALGMLCTILGYVLIFFSVYRWLGWIHNPRSVVRFWFLAAIFPTALVSAALLLGFSPGLVGLALQTGLVVGTFLYPLSNCFDASFHIRKSSGDGKQRTLAIALLACIAGHFMEMAFAFEVIATATLFWTYLGLLIALIVSSGEDSKVPDPVSSKEVLDVRRQDRNRKSPATGVPSAQFFNAWSPGLVGGILTSFLLIPFLYAFGTNYSAKALNFHEILLQIFVSKDTDHQTAFPVLVAFLLTWLVAGFLLSFGRSEADAKNWWRSLPWIFAFSCGLAVVYALIRAAQTLAIGAFPSVNATAPEVLAAGNAYEKIYFVFLLSVLGLILFGGWVVATANKTDGPGGSRFGFLAGFAALGLVPSATLGFSLNPIRADLWLHWGEILHAQRVRPGSLAAFARAGELAPREPVCFARQAQAFRDLAVGEWNENKMSALMKQAETALLDSQKITMLDRSDYLLGMLYFEWSLRVSEASERAVLAQKASLAFVRARNFEPFSENIWNEEANLDSLLFDPAQGTQKNQHAYSLVPSGRRGEFGVFYAGRSLAAKPASLQRLYAAHAVRYLESAKADQTLDSSTRFASLMARGHLHRAMNEWKEAALVFGNASALESSSQSWQADVAAVEACLQIRRQAEALQYLDTAIGRAPKSKASELLRLKSQLSSTP